MSAYGLFKYVMELTLTVIRYQNLPPRQPMTVSIGTEGGTVGRSSDNDLILTDPDRWVSAHHARVSFRNGAFYLTDTSRNGTFVNHAAEPVGQGREIELRNDDELTIGAYEVRVSMVARQPQGAHPFDPFATGEGGQAAQVESWSGESEPDILDLLAATPPARKSPSELEPQVGTVPEPDRWPTAESGEEEPRAPDLAHKRAEVPAALAEPDHTPDVNAFFRPPNAIPEDYDVWADQTGRAPEDAEVEITGEQRVDSQPSAPAAETEPQPEPEPVHPPPQAPEDTPAVDAVGDIDALKAFLDGLGHDVPQADPAAQARTMRTAGLLLRTMTEGLMRVMMGRASFKSELRLEMTTIRAAENNPFKFSVDPDDALDHLLFRPSRGFLPPVEAAREAFGDIQRHEMAIIAGLRAALRALLARLDPAELEQRFRDRTVLDNLMPMARKAKYWDLFTDTYNQIAADAAEDFMRLFGDAFTRAYEDQTYRLKQTGGREEPPSGR